MNKRPPSKPEVKENDITDACPDLLLIDDDKEVDVGVDLEIEIV